MRLEKPGRIPGTYPAAVERAFWYANSDRLGVGPE